MDGFHLLKTAKGVTFSDQLTDWTLMQRSSDQENNIVNHVSIPLKQNHAMQTPHNY